MLEIQSVDCKIIAFTMNFSTRSANTILLPADLHVELV